MTETIEPTRLPLIGDPAPAFEVESTHGVISLDDYKGKWIMLFSHPADFTPVCTTEFIAFAQNIEEFEKRNVQLIGNPSTRSSVTSGGCSPSSRTQESRSPSRSSPTSR